MKLRIGEIVLAAVLAALIYRAPASAQQKRLVIESPMPFPKSSQVEIKKIDAAWGPAEAATPSVKLTVLAEAKVNSSNASDTADVSALTADITADRGKTWKTAVFMKDEKAPGVWTADVEFPEFSGGGSARPAAGAEEDAPSGAEEDAGENASQAEDKSLISLGGITIGNETRGLSKRAPKPSPESTEPPAEPPTEPPAGPAGSATAVICFSATDSLGNTTVELFNQADPAFERDVHFTPVLSDASESASGGAQAARDITGVSAAWLRGSIYVKAAAAAALNKNSLQTSGRLNYFVARFISTKTIPDAEQLGEGLFSYLLLDKVMVWQKGNAFGNQPVTITVNFDFVGKLIKLMNTDEKKLPPELKKLKKDILQGKINPATDYFITKKAENTGLGTQVAGNQIYWKINKEALTDAKNEAGVFRLTVFSGWRQNPGSGNFTIDDRTLYTTIALKHHVLAFGQSELSEEYRETPPAPVVAPPGLPPGAIWGY